MKGKQAVQHAITFLSNAGFSTSEAQNEYANGHDIVAIKNGRGFTFEVKPAIYKQRSWRISKVIKKTSDGIIIVFPSGAIEICSMKDHLSLCSQSGIRFLTFSGLIYE